jgi:hypothetical protein
MANTLLFVKINEGVEGVKKVPGPHPMLKFIICEETISSF